MHRVIRFIVVRVKRKQRVKSYKQMLKQLTPKICITIGTHAAWCCAEKWARWSHKLFERQREIYSLTHVKRHKNSKFTWKIALKSQLVRGLQFLLLFYVPPNGNKIKMVDARRKQHLIRRWRWAHTRSFVSRFERSGEKDDLLDVHLQVLLKFTRARIQVDRHWYVSIAGSFHSSACFRMSAPFALAIIIIIIIHLAQSTHNGAYNRNEIDDSDKDKARGCVYLAFVQLCIHHYVPWHQLKQFPKVININLMCRWICSRAEKTNGWTADIIFMCIHFNFNFIFFFFSIKMSARVRSKKVKIWFAARPTWMLSVRCSHMQTINAWMDEQSNDTRVPTSR